MNLLLRAAAAAALLLPLAVAPATAQNYRGAWTLHGGGVWFSDLNNNGDFDLGTLTPEQIDVFFPGLDPDDLTGASFLDLTLDPGWIAGTQFEVWFGRGRFGLRANGLYTERSFDLDVGDDNVFDLIDDGIGNFTFGDVNTWLLDGDIMIRILTPRRGRTWAPFLSLGAGVAIYNPAGDGGIVLPEANVIWNGDDGNGKTRFATAFGLGTDILPGWNLGSIGIGLRLEIADHIAWNSPADPLFGDDDFDPVHNVRLTAGVMGLFGRLFPEEVVAVVPPPPAPPAPPAEETISVCVVDPTMPQGIGNVSAIYVPSTRDTLIVVNGQRTPIEQAYDRVVVARETDWFVRGQPLILQVNEHRAEFVTYGGARIIEPTDLAFIGTVDGLPVYADADDVRDIREELRELREAQRTDDIEDILEEREDLREEFEEIEVLYVPLQSVGCVFQPVRRVEEVRKVRG